MESPIRKHFGLIGKKLSHSFSQQYFTKKFADLGLQGHTYELIELDCIDQILYWLLENGDHLIGLNVTIPYKEAIIPYLDYIHPDAKAIGAVNTIKKIDGSLHGYNTDVYGFITSLKNQVDLSRIQSALILGTGGASKAVAHALKQSEINYQKVSRNRSSAQLAYTDLTPDRIVKYDLIINATPIGTYPETNEAPDIPYGYLEKHQILYDLIYNPSKTLFLEHGMERGCQIVNGLEMLHLQAEKAWEIWTTHDKK